MGRTKKVFERVGEIEMTEDIKFCPTCGKEAGEGTKFCPKCGYNFDTGRQKMQHAVATPSPENKIILAVIVSIILIGVFIGSAFMLASLEIPEDNNYIDTGEDTIPEEIPEEEEEDNGVDYSQYDDSEFLIWLTNTVVDTLVTDFTMIGTYAENYDFAGVAEWSGKLEDHSILYLSQIDNYDVTPQMDVIKEEIRLAFQDCEMAGYYGRVGAENFNADTINLAVKYMNYATVHISTATDYIENFEV